LPVWAASNALGVASVVALLAEMHFKGLVNFLGAPFTNLCNVHHGITFLLAIPGAICIFFTNVIVKPSMVFCRMVLDPTDLANRITFQM